MPKGASEIAYGNEIVPDGTVADRFFGKILFHYEAKPNNFTENLFSISLRSNFTVLMFKFSL